MKRCTLPLLLCFFVFNVYSQAPCDNEDFELSPEGAVTTTAGVQGWYAKRLTGTSANNCTGINSTFTSAPTSVQIFTVPPSGLIDPNIGPTYPVFSVFGTGTANGGNIFNPDLPNDMLGNVVLRLNTTTSSGDYHILEKSISVSTLNCLFRVATLPVLQMGTNCCDAPSLKMMFMNASGGNTVLPCTTSSVNVPSPQCNIVNSPSLMPLESPTTFTTLYFRPWTIQSFDLSPYIGSTLIFRLGVSGCTCGGKTGYAYVDAQCGPMEILVNNVPFPANTNSVSFMGCGLQTATVVAPPDFSSYQWNGPAGFSSTLSTISTTAAGVYTLDITTAGTCSVITKYVNIGLYPAPQLSLSSSQNAVCKGNSVKIVATGLSTYTWNVPGVSTGTINASPQQNFTYSVSGVDANGCPASASITQSVIACVSLSEQSTAGGVAIFPNPAKGEFIVRINGMNGAALIINSVSGTRVHKQELLDGDNIIRSEKLIPGIYYCQIESQGKICGKGKIRIE